jgi:hypothetical protein
MAARESKWSGVFGGGGGGGGDVTGPGSSTDGSLSEFNGTSGELIRESTARIESDDLSLAGQLVKFNRGGTDGTAEGSGLRALGNAGATLAELLYDSTLASKWKAGPNGSLSAVLTAGATQTVQNKTLDNTNSIDVPDDQLRIEDTADPTKKIRFDAGAVTAGQTRVISAIDEDLELLGRTNTQTVQNKTHQDSIFDGGSASSARKIILPKGIKTALDALTQEEGLLTYATDEDRGYLSNGTAQIKIGTVDGPASATDNQLARFDGTTGKMIQDSAIGVNDSGDMAGIRDLDMTGDLLVGGNAVITGNLEVQGTETTLNTDELQVEDPTIQVNFGGTDASAEGAGIEALGTGNVARARLQYDSALPSKWKAGAAGSEKEILTAGDTQAVSSKTLNNTNSAALKDDQFTLEDPADSTKKLRFDAGNVTPGQTRVISAIDEDIELLGRTNTQIVTNKDIDGGTAADTRRITLPKDTFANLLLLTRKEGTLLYATDLDQVFYDNGSSLLPVGSGSSGEKNYIVNSAANSTNGWAATGGTFARTTTAANLPREFTTGSALAFTSSTDEEYVRYRFSLDDVDLGAKLKWVLDYISSTANFRLEMWKNTASDYSSSYTEIPLEWDVSGDSYLVAAASSANYKTTFDTDTTPYLELRIVHNGTGTDTIYFSDVLVGPRTTETVPAVGKWQSLPVTLTNMGTGASASLRYKQDTDSIEIEGTFTTGTSIPASVGKITLGLTGISFTPSVVRIVGMSGISKAITDNVLNMAGVLIDPASDPKGLFFSQMATGAATNNHTALNASSIFSASTTHSLFARIPIAEWAGAGLNTGPGVDGELKSTSGTWDANSSTTVSGGSAIGGTLTAARTKTITWTYPIQSDDDLEVLYSPDNIIWTPFNASRIGTTPIIPGIDSTGTEVSGVFWKHISSTQTEILFGRFANIANDDSPTANYPASGYWAARKRRANSIPFPKAKAYQSGLVAPRTGQTSLTVTGTNWTTARAVGIYYQDQDGNHRLKFNIMGTLSSAAASFTGSISGVTFKNLSNYFQAISAYTQEDSVAIRTIVGSYVQPNASTFYVGSSGNANRITVSADVEIESKPTWA